MPRDDTSTLTLGHCWDAVQVPQVESIQAIAAIGPARVGPVVDDQERELHWWLVAPGRAKGWGLPGVQVLGYGARLQVPPADAPLTAILRWASPPTAPLTDPPVLHQALAEICARRYGPADGYRSADCRVGEHGSCTTGHVNPRTEDGVVIMACDCRCHRDTRVVAVR
jgi:hypothetical protein